MKREMIERKMADRKKMKRTDQKPRKRGKKMKRWNQQRTNPDHQFSVASFKFSSPSSSVPSENREIEQDWTQIAVRRYPRCLRGATVTAVAGLDPDRGGVCSRLEPDCGGV